MTQYRITWEIDYEADSPYEAAQYARNVQMVRNTTATVFDVADEHGNITRIDLLDENPSQTEAQ